jgi:hypothetical protein
MHFFHEKCMSSLAISSMEPDVAGEPRQDLNRPANSRRGVSLDEYRPVISNHTTERCTVPPHAACGALASSSFALPLSSPSETPLHLGVAAHYGDQTSLSGHGHTLSKFTTTAATLAKPDTIGEPAATIATALAPATLAPAVVSAVASDTSALADTTTTTASPPAIAIPAKATSSVDLVHLNPINAATTALQVAVNCNSQARIDRLRNTHTNTERMVTPRIRGAGLHSNPTAQPPPHASSAFLPDDHEPETPHTRNSTTPITHPFLDETRLNGNFLNKRHALFTCMPFPKHKLPKFCLLRRRNRKPLTLLLSRSRSSMEPNTEGTSLPPPDAQMGPSRKRGGRTAPAGQLESIRAAINMVEIALIFDTSDGKKGAYGGLGDTNARTRDSVERTMNSIITATLPGVQYEQCRVDQISVYKEPSFFIILLVTQATADAILGATSVVCKLIDYIIAGTTAEEDGKPRAGVSIVVTTPSQIPSLPMFGGRTDTSIQAGDQVPGIQVVMYIQNTREHRVAHETLRIWAMDELMNDLDKVLTDERQPLSGFKTQTIPGQPTRLIPKTPGGVATGMSVKFWLIAPISPRDIASIAGIILPSPILFPLKIAEDPASPVDTPQFITYWTHDPDDPQCSNMTRAMRCQGGKNNAGDGVHVRYVVNNVRGTIMQADDGEQFWRAGDDAEEESHESQGLTVVPTKPHGHDEQRAQRRKNAANAQAAKIDKECMKAHATAFATIYFSTGTCDEAIKRLSTRDSPTFVPADRAMDFATKVEIPSEVLNAACRSDKCRTNMCISLNRTAVAVLAARTEGRAKAAANLETNTPTARPPTQAARLSHPKAPMAVAKPPEEHRYDVGGTEAYTKAKFFAFYGDHEHWEAAGAAPKNSRAATDLATAQANASAAQAASQSTFGYGTWRKANGQGSTTMPTQPKAPTPTAPQAITAETAETQQQKAARTPFQASPGRLQASPGHQLSAATNALGISEYGSVAPAGFIADAVMEETAKVHGWNWPMPLPNEADLGGRIPSTHLNAARKLAHGLARLAAPYAAQGGFVPFTHIEAYMAFPCEIYGTFDADTTEDLMHALDDANVVAVSQYEPGGDAETQYLAQFLIEPTLLP